MEKREFDSYFDEFEEDNNIPLIRNMPHREQRPGWTPRTVRSPNRVTMDEAVRRADQTGDQDGFDFSYTASRHEQEWIVSSLGRFYDGQWLDDVVRLLQGGKEAHVYQCLANTSVSELSQPYIAAKVYRPRRFRSLKKDHLYREGRGRLDEDGNVIIDGGRLHAMNQRSAYGLKLLHGSWIEHEFQTLKLLHCAGVDVPLPLERGDNAILMEYIGGEDTPAPILNSLHLDPGQAKLLFERVLVNVEKMLTHNRVHADLSAYNILYWSGRITLIDFPQAIDPNENRSAFLIFARDIRRICEYFTRQGVECDSREIAANLWTSHGFRLRPEVHPALLDDQDEGDIAYWRGLR